MEEFEDVETMLKLKYEKKLMSDISEIFEDFAKKNEIYVTGKRQGKRYRNKCLKRALKNYCLGIKNIDKKIPVFIELPKLEERENGQYEEIKNSKKETDEQIIHVSDLPNQIEESRENVRKLIE